MRIEINGDGEEKKETVTITNDIMNTDNFVDIVVGDKEITVSVSELHSAVQAFMVLRENNKVLDNLK